MTDKDGNDIGDPTTKQRAFVEHYLVCWNATEAARRAGYSVATAQQQGSRLLSRPHIKITIESRFEAIKQNSVLGTEKFIANKKTKSGYVYLIREQHGLVKIGKAVDVDKRIATIRAFVPYDIDTLFVIETDGARKLEADLHSRFREKRRNGEWFSLSSEDIESVRREYGTHE